MGAPARMKPANEKRPTSLSSFTVVLSPAVALSSMIEIGSSFDDVEPLKMEVRGRCLREGLLKRVAAVAQGSKAGSLSAVH
jgi:hypothetical protein